MKKIISFLCCLLATAVLFLACDKDEKGKPDFQKLLTREQITLIPEILTLQGTLIPVEFQINVPARFLPRKALLTLTPVLICDQKEYRADARTWEGERVEIGSDVIFYDNPTRISLLSSFIYKEAMKQEYELYLEVNIIDGPVTTFRILIDKNEFRNIPVE